MIAKYYLEDFDSESIKTVSQYALRLPFSRRYVHDEGKLRKGKREETMIK